jgi:hypothetical protein
MVRRAGSSNHAARMSAIPVRSPGLRRARRTLAFWLCAAGVAHASAAHAEGIGGQFATDKGVKSVVGELLSKDVHFTLSAGLWLAFLGNGFVSGASAANSDDRYDPSDKVGTGRGFLRDVSVSIDVKGNEVFFRYLSDELLRVGEDEIAKRTPNSPVKPLIRQLVGELRPDLSKLLGSEAKTYARVMYGKFVGGIADPYLFGSRDGLPYFAGPEAKWSTQYVSVEAGVGKKGHDLGLFARYTSFSKPAVLGTGTTNGGYALQNAGVQIYGIGVRYLRQSCDGICAQLDASGIPGTGYTTVDMGRWGSVAGLPVVAAVEGRLLFPFNAGPIPVAPYVAFRAETMLLLVSGFDPSKLTTTSQPYFLAPDYLLWGPSVGITGEL